MWEKGKREKDEIEKAEREQGKQRGKSGSSCRKIGKWETWKVMTEKRKGRSSIGKEARSWKIKRENRMLERKQEKPNKKILDLEGK